MLIYPPARSQALARIWMILCLLKIAVRSELAKGKGLPLLSVAVRSEMASGTRGRTSLIRVKGTGGCTSLVRSQVTRSCTAELFTREK